MYDEWFLIYIYIYINVKNHSKKKKNTSWDGYYTVIIQKKKKKDPRLNFSLRNIYCFLLLFLFPFFLPDNFTQKENQKPR